jgi:hypothetical protein
MRLSCGSPHGSLAFPPIVSLLESRGPRARGQATILRRPCPASFAGPTLSCARLPLRFFPLSPSPLSLRLLWRARSLPCSRDQQLPTAGREKEGRKEGREEGRERGRKERKKERREGVSERASCLPVSQSASQPASLSFFLLQRLLRRGAPADCG